MGQQTKRSPPSGVRPWGPLKIEKNAIFGHKRKFLPTMRAVIAIEIPLSALILDKASIYTF